MDAYAQRVITYCCPKCGLIVPQSTVDNAVSCSLFVCDCGWQGDAVCLHRSMKTVYGDRALRVAVPPSSFVH